MNNKKEKKKGKNQKKGEKRRTDREAPKTV